MNQNWQKVRNLLYKSRGHGKTDCRRADGRRQEWEKTGKLIECREKNGETDIETLGTASITDGLEDEEK